MNKVIVEMPNKSSGDIGSCFDKCIQLMYQFYGIDLMTHELTGIANVLETYYQSYSLNYECENEKLGTIIINRRSATTAILNKKLPLNFEWTYYNDYQEANYNLLNNINNGFPTMIAVNPYFLHFTKDYLVNPGGYFKNYHMLIVYGLDKTKNKFIVVDPTFNIQEAYITHEELFKAWTYQEGINNFIPYRYYRFKIVKKSNQYMVDDICINSVKDNVECMLNKCNIVDSSSSLISGLEGLGYIVKDIEKIVKNEVDGNIKNTLINNLHFSIFHGLRWTRKSFAYFLGSEKLNKLPQRDTHIKNFEHFFDLWTNISYLLIMASKKNSDKELIIAKQKISDLIELERKEAVCLNNDVQLLIECNNIHKN